MRHLIWILLFCLNAPLAFAALDLNTASEAELDALPGVGPSRAQAIIEYRKAHGRFASVDELGSVKGIGDKTLAELKPLLTVGAVTPPAPSASPVPEGPVRPVTGSSGGFPWWILAVGVVVGIAAFLFMRRRAASAPAQPELPAAPEASAPVRKPSASVPPRPAASAPLTSSEPAAMPAAPPPRPAGSLPPQASAVSSGCAPPAVPKPAGVPPKPAGSR